MEIQMGTAIAALQMAEIVFVSFLFALWLAWMGLRALFHVMASASGISVAQRPVARAFVRRTV